MAAKTKSKTKKKPATKPKMKPTMTKKMSPAARVKAKPAKSKSKPAAKPAAKKAKLSAIPAGFTTVTPHLTIRGCAEAIDYYKKAFGAKELTQMPGPGGLVMHCTLQIGDARIMVNDEFPEMGGKSPASLNGSPVTVHLYVEDADAVFSRAVRAGGREVMPIQDTFWGDRYGVIVDPFGHIWSIATQIAILTPAEIQERMMSAMPCEEPAMS